MRHKPSRHIVINSVKSLLLLDWYYRTPYGFLHITGAESFHNSSSDGSTRFLEGFVLLLILHILYSGSSCRQHIPIILAADHFLHHLPFLFFGEVSIVIVGHSALCFTSPFFLSVLL